MRRLAVSLAAVSLVVAGCGDDGGGGSTSDPIRIGQIASLTGNYTPLGSENKKSVELAIEKINRDGGVLGRQLEVVVKDDRSQPDQAVLAFNDLRGDVTAVIGSSFSNSALATIPAVDRAEIPYVSLAPADEQVNPVHPYVFMVPAKSSTYAERILEYLQATGVTKVAVAHDTRSSYAVAGYEGTKAKAGDYGVTLSVSEEFQTDATEFGALFGHVRSSDAQALIVWATGPPAVALTKQYASAGLNIPLVLTGAQASKLFLDPVGPAAEGVTVASSIGVVGSSLPGGKQKDAIDELTTSFTDKYGYPPPQFAQDGYSGVKLLVAAIEKAGSTEPEQIRAALEGLTLVTPNGEYSYSKSDHSGLGPEFISVNTVSQGAFRPTDWSAEQLAGMGS